MHILLIRFSSLGDIILQTSVISWLQSQYAGDLKISFALSQEYQDLIKDHSSITHLFKFDRKKKQSMLEFSKEIKKIHQEEKIDLIIDLHGTLRSFLLRKFLYSIPSIVVDKKRLIRWLMVRFSFLPLFNSSIIKKFFNIDLHVKRVPQDFANILLSPFYGKTNTFMAPVKSKKKSIRGEYIVISPVASFESKRWPVKNFAILIDLLLKQPSLSLYNIIIVGGPKDDYCQEIKINDPRVINLQGKLSLVDTQAIISEASLLIGNDSGTSHMAEAQNVSVISIFGPTHENFGFAPYLEKSQVVSVNLWCRPCSTTGKKKCFRKRHYCMDLITPKRICEMVVMQL